MRWPWLGFTVATPVVVYLAVLVGLPVAHDWLFGVLADSVEGPEPNALDPGFVHLSAGALALAATIAVVRGLWGRRRSTEAWAKGAIGEELTADLLARLPAGFIVRHDLRLPGSRANIDHLVIGPSGVFTIETKHYRADVDIRRDGVWSRGRRLDKVVAQAQRQSQAVARVLDVPVQAVVVIHGGRVSIDRGAAAVVDGVRFCSGRRLLQAVTERPATLSEVDVARLCRTVDERFRPA